MDQPWILLVDCCRGELGRRLAEIIESSGQFRLCRHQEPIQDALPASRARALKERIKRLRPALIVIALGRLSMERDQRFLRSIPCRPSSVPILLAADSCKPSEILALLSCGASDFLVPPLSALDVLTRVGRFLKGDGSEKRLTHPLQAPAGFKKIVGRSPAFLEVMETVSAVSGCDAAVLISGETGTGKELCARSIHYGSPRAGKPFVSVNCGALPVDLVENELFGHRRAAYTGASTSTGGLIQEAEGGTLLLDEIDCLAPKAQVKLLRFLQEKEYRPLGGASIRKADVRVVAATNADPAQAVASGRLRQDLYYRLNTVHILLPPLRDRPEDIPLLARHFLAKFAQESGKPSLQITHDALLALQFHDWPGNVREMEHVIERAVILCKGSALRASEMKLPRPLPCRIEDSFRRAKARVVNHFERTYIEGLLLNHQGNITLAAKAACKHRRAFWELMRKHRIDADRFKNGAQTLPASA